jgi:hypothetical protein
MFVHTSIRPCKPIESIAAPFCLSDPCSCAQSELEVEYRRRYYEKVFSESLHCHVEHGGCHAGEHAEFCVCQQGLVPVLVGRDVLE